MSRGRNNDNAGTYVVTINTGIQPKTMKHSVGLSISFIGAFDILLER